MANEKEAGLQGKGSAGLLGITLVHGIQHLLSFASVTFAGSLASVSPFVNYQDPAVRLWGAGLYIATPTHHHHHHFPLSGGVEGVEVRIWTQKGLLPCCEPWVPMTRPASCTGGQAGPGHSGTLFAETEFPCLCFSIIILAGGIFPRGSGLRGSAMAVSPPAPSVSSHSALPARLP